MHKQHLYKLLTEQGNELSERINKINNDLKNRHMSKKASQQNIERANDDVLARLKVEAEMKLMLTKEAIKHLNGDVFGHCVECANPISDDRLEVLPHAQLCRHCAHKHEQNAITAEI